MFRTILIANRGEIACRVIRTARRLGYRSVAVFSEADARAPHVALADAAVCIGEAAATRSYLDIGSLLAAARRTGADAVHPGYGFLSERAAFARACTEAGLVFIGPPAASMEIMGDKARAKQRMQDCGVPCAPGYLGEDADDATLAAQALRLGLPLLIKAVAAGGGRGIRRVQHAGELDEALASARREAQAAFGDDRLMLEQPIEDARHIEVQIFADSQGHTVHLGERDCTTQRRRQKLLEEAPSPRVDPTLRAALGADAVVAARAVGYVGAGTVEFLVDRGGRHYFLEMNTRLQVEHPVTECITGLDLVEWQLRVAAGEPLPRRQEEIQWQGHAVEARLYAEDPWQGFRPQTGRVAWWRPDAALRPGMRVDAAVVEGDTVGPHYDALLAKLIVHGRDRPDALRRLGALLEDAPLLGLATNGPLLRALLEQPDFVRSSMSTTTLDDWAERGEGPMQLPRPTRDDWLLAAGLLALRPPGGAGSRPAGLAAYELELDFAGERRRLRVHAQAQGAQLELDGGSHHAQWLGTAADGRIRFCLDGVQRSVAAVVEGAGAGRAARVEFAWAGRRFVFEEPSPYPQAWALADPLRLAAPLAGTVARLPVGVGDAVTPGQALACVEAMKMETWLAASVAGRVRAVHVRVGDAVAAGTLLVELEAAP